MLGSTLYHHILCELEQVIWNLRFFFFSSVKWEWWESLPPRVNRIMKWEKYMQNTYPSTQLFCTKGSMNASSCCCTFLCLVIHLLYVKPNYTCVNWLVWARTQPHAQLVALSLTHSGASPVVLCSLPSNQWLADSDFSVLEVRWGNTTATQKNLDSSPSSGDLMNCP